MSRRPLPGLAAILSLPLAAALFTGCGEDRAPAEVELRAVRYIVAQKAAGGRVRTFSGTSRSSQESRLSFKVSGTIDALPVEVGDHLNQGDLVSRLAPAQYELEVERALADLAQARANERNAAAVYQRTKELYADNNAARSDLDSARANAESATAQVGAAEKQVELARLNVGYTRLHAATDCSVAAIEVEVNENVNAGSTVAIVNCGHQIEVDLAIPESVIAELEAGMEATVRFGALDDESFPGRVTEVGVAAREGATFPVTVVIDGTGRALRSGLAAEVSFRTGQGTASTTILVPLTAVVEGADGVFVYLAEPAEKAGEAVVARRAVELGELTEEGMEIKSGLMPGDRVITAGTTVIREGLRVLVDAADPA